MHYKYGVILEGTADMSSVCYFYKKGSQKSVCSNLALWPTSDFDLWWISKIYNIMQLLNLRYIVLSKRLYLWFYCNIIFVLIVQYFLIKVLFTVRYTKRQITALNLFLPLTNNCPQFLCAITKTITKIAEKGRILWF